MAGLDGDDTSSTVYLDDLNPLNPDTDDPKSQGDNHLRFVKRTLVNTFPNITGAVTPTQTELNYVDGVTSAIQTQLDTLEAGKAEITRPRKNMLINGDFSVWQRGTSFSTPTSVYTADRWKAIANGSSGFASKSGAGLTLNYGLSGGTGYLWQPIELVDAGTAWPFVVGDIVTISGSVYTTDTANDVQIMLQYRDNSTGGVNNVTELDYTSIGTLAVGWNNFSITHTLAQTLNGTNTCLCLVIKQVQNGAVGCTYKKLQIEIGAEATDYDVRPLSEEVNSCVRYYRKLRMMWSGYASNGYSNQVGISLVPPMRTNPTVTYDTGGQSNFPSGAPSAWSYGPNECSAYKTANATGPGYWYHYAYCDAEL